MSLPSRTSVPSRSRGPAPARGECPPPCPRGAGGMRGSGDRSHLGRVGDAHREDLSRRPVHRHRHPERADTGPAAAGRTDRRTRGGRVRGQPSGERRAGDLDRAGGSPGRQCTGRGHDRRVLFCRLPFGRPCREASGARSCGGLQPGGFDLPLGQRGPRGELPVRQVHPFDESWGTLLQAERQAYSP